MTTDDDLTRQLSDLLTRSAEAVDVHPDLDAVTDGPAVISLVDHDHGGPGGDRRRRVQPARRLALGAVAAAAVVALVAAAFAIRDDPDEPVASGPAPSTITPPDRAIYPVVDEWPEGFEPVTPSLADIGEGAEVGPTVVLGDDLGGAVVDGVVVRSFRTTPTVYEMAETTPVTIGSRQGFTLESWGHAGEPLGPTLVLPGDDATLVLYGHDPVGLLRSAPDAITAHVTDGEIDVVVDGLPPGVEVLSETRPSAERMWPSLLSSSHGSGNPPAQVMVDIRPDDPLAAVAWAGIAGSTEASGVPGWMVANDGATYLAREMGEGVTLVVSGPVDADTALAVSGATRLVDRSEWEETYDLDDETTSSTTTPGTPTTPGAAPTTGVASDDGEAADGQPTVDWLDDHPLLDQPLPPFLVDGEDVPIPTGRWTVMVVGGSWCVPCLRLLDDLDDVWDRRPAAQANDLVFVAWGDDADDLEALRSDAPVHWDPRPVDADLIDRWQVSDAPSILLVDPRGVVRAVAPGQLDAMIVYTTLLGLDQGTPSPTNPYCSYPDRVTGTTTC